MFGIPVKALCAGSLCLLSLGTSQSANRSSRAPVSSLSWLPLSLLFSPERTESRWGDALGGGGCCSPITSSFPSHPSIHYPWSSKPQSSCLARCTVIRVTARAGAAELSLPNLYFDCGFGFFIKIKREWKDIWCNTCKSYKTEVCAMLLHALS